MYTLELNFVTSNGKTVKISLDNPTLPVNPSVVTECMDNIVNANIFMTSNGEIVAPKGIRLVERNETEYEVM